MERVWIYQLKEALYHAELPNSVSDIALVNTSNQTLNSNEDRYSSVTVSAHGTATSTYGI